jgi:cell division protease FtsH
MEDIEESFMKSLLGPQKKSRIRTEKENKLTAYHEAGHAVVSYFCKNTDPVRHITIIPAGRAGGVTVSVPEQDVSYSTKGDMLDNIRMSLGGRIAEELIMDDISTGASSDIQHATSTARSMVTRYGMSEKLGTVLYGSEHSNDAVFLGRDFSSGKNYSEETAALIDAEIKKIIDEAYANAKALLMANRDKLDFITDFLCKYEIMDDEEFTKAMQDGTTMAELDFMVELKRKKSQDENEAQRKANEEAARREEEERKKRDAELARMNRPYGDLK